MAEAYTNIRIRIFKRDHQTGLYPIEASVDGGREHRGQMEIDLTELLALRNSPKDYGLELFYSLFAGRIRRAYDVASGQAESNSNGRLRVRMQIDDAAPELHAVRWEALYHTYRGEDVPLAISADTPFSRYNALEASLAEPLQPPLRLLFAISNPSDLADSDLAPLDVEAEIRSLVKALDQHKRSAQLQVTIMPGHTALSGPLHAELDAVGYKVVGGAASLENLARQLPECHIFHFLGHGVYSRSGEQAVLVLEREDGGKSKYVPDKMLAGRLRPLNNLRLVFLAACESARRDADLDGPNPFVGLAPKLVQAGVPAVVAMQDVVEIDAARQLSAQFYDHLLQHGYVDQALNMARYTLYNDEDTQWTIPVLYMRMTDGRLFTQEPAKPSVESGRAQQQSNAGGPVSHQVLIELRNILAQRFSSGDLKTLVFDLDVEYDDLPGQTRSSKAQELVSYCQRRSLIPKLVEVGQRQRPDINWPLIT